MTLKTEAPARRGALANWAAATAAAGLAAWAGTRLKTRPGTSGTRAAPGRLPDVPLLTHEGKRVRFHTDLVQDRVVLVNMMYAQCSNICPPVTYNLRRVQDALGRRVGRDIFMYSISLQPEFDRPADLKAYAQRHEVKPGWTFLTGEKGQVEALRYALGFYDPDPAVDADLAQHTGTVRMGNEALDRWCMTPALVDSGRIMDALRAVDPVSRSVTSRRFA